MLEAQRLEQAMVGLIGVRGELDAVEREDMEEFRRAQDEWERLFTFTAGQLRRLLALEGEGGDEVERAVRARNLLAHHYLRDWQWEMDQPADRQRMAVVLIESAERFRALTDRLDAEQRAAMEEHGLTEDHITTPDEARALRYWNPYTDGIEPPEPWDEGPA